MVKKTPSDSPRPKSDPHNWNTLDHYRSIHDRCLETHSFVDHTRPDTLKFTDLGDTVRLEGKVFCLRGVILAVEKILEVCEIGRQRKVRGKSYCYAAWIEGKHTILKYHNIHNNDDDYHRRAYDLLTGEEVSHKTVERREFPIFTDVLDELETMTDAL